MDIETVKQQLINNGQNPNDFTIVQNKEGFSVTPKPSYTQRQIAKEEVAVVQSDIDVVAQTITLTLDDMQVITDTINYLLSEVAILKGVQTNG